MAACGHDEVGEGSGDVTSSDVDGRVKGSAVDAWRRCSFRWERRAIGRTVVFLQGTSSGVGEDWQTANDQIAFGVVWVVGPGGQGSDFFWDWEGAADGRQKHVETLHLPFPIPLDFVLVGPFSAAMNQTTD